MSPVRPPRRPAANQVPDRLDPGHRQVGRQVQVDLAGHRVQRAGRAAISPVPDPLLPAPLRPSGHATTPTRPAGLGVGLPRGRSAASSGPGPDQPRSSARSIGGARGGDPPRPPGRAAGTGRPAPGAPRGRWPAGPRPYRQAADQVVPPAPPTAQRRTIRSGRPARQTAEGRPSRLAARTAGSPRPAAGPPGPGSGRRSRPCRHPDRQARPGSRPPPHQGGQSPPGQSAPRSARRLPPRPARPAPTARRRHVAGVQLEAAHPRRPGQPRTPLCRTRPEQHDLAHASAHAAMIAHRGAGTATVHNRRAAALGSSPGGGLPAAARTPKPAGRRTAVRAGRLLRPIPATVGPVQPTPVQAGG